MKNPTAKRIPLSRDRVLVAAMEIADVAGIDGLTMRAVGDRLGVEAMSLYNHVANKEALLAGMINAVFAEIHLPVVGPSWRDEVRRRSISLRDALTRHPWAIGLMESGLTPGPATLGQHDAVLGVLSSAGFPVELVAHAFSAVDSYTYGFALQESALPFREGDDVGSMAEGMLAQFPDGAYPHLAEFTRAHVAKPGYAYADEYDFGLELVLDGIERALEAIRR